MNRVAVWLNTRPRRDGSVKSSALHLHQMFIRVRTFLLASICACSKTTRVTPKAQTPEHQADATQQARASCAGPGALAPRVDARNVLGQPLQSCPSKLITGFNRNGYCNTGPSDKGVHVVCAAVSDAFLSFTRAQGNDLSTPRGDFPGLKSGDGWCLCAERWREADAAGVAPAVYIEATDIRALDFVEKQALTSHAVALSKIGRAHV